jgi:purine-nucleoside phosphorylase
MPQCFEDYKKSADYILDKAGSVPRIAVVLGSGLGSFADEVEEPVVLDYSSIPGFLKSTAPGHKGKMYIGRVDTKPAIVMAGRFHCYEGYSFEEAASYIRVLHLAGVENIILTTAAGCLNESFKVGELMMVCDQINFSGYSPCTGINDDRIGPRFFDMTNTYDRSLRLSAKASVDTAGITLREGVYAYMTGPQFETPAEIRALRLLGADAVGMSTVPEAIEAAHCGMKVLCISCLTNYAAGITGKPLSGQEVDETASKSGVTFRRLLKVLINDLF